MSAFVTLSELVLSVLGTMTLFPMLFGKPRLEWDFREEADEDRRLFIIIHNQRVKNRALLTMGVTRSSANMRANYRIWDGEERLISHGVAWLTVGNEAPAIAVRLEDHFWVYVPCLFQSDVLAGSGYAVAGAEDRSEAVWIPPGVYRYELELSTSSGARLLARYFQIAPNELMWLEDAKPWYLR